MNDTMTEAPTDQEKSKKRNGFTMQPNCIWDVPFLNVQEICIWEYLNTHSDEFNPALSEISKKTRVSKPTVLKALKALESYNMIKVIRGKQGSNRDSNKYFTVDNSEWDFSSGKYKNLNQVKEKTGSGKGENLIRLKRKPDQVKISTTKNTKENNNQNTKRESIASDSRKPPKFKFDDWQFSLAQEWIAYHQEHFPGTKPKPEQWANQIRIISQKRPQLTQESFSGLLKSIRSDSFWCDKATSLPSLNKPSKSNPDVLKIDQVMKSIRAPKKKIDCGIDEIFADELKAMRANDSKAFDVGFDNIPF